MYRSSTCSSKHVGAPFGPEGSWHSLAWLKTTWLHFHSPPEEKPHPLLLIGNSPSSAATLFCAQTLSWKNETLGRGQNCATHSPEVSQQLGLEHLSLLCFPFQSRLQSYVPSLILSCTCTISLIAKL